METIEASINKSTIQAVSQWIVGHSAAHPLSKAAGDGQQEPGSATLAEPSAVTKGGSTLSALTDTTDVEGRPTPRRDGRGRSEGSGPRCRPASALSALGLTRSFPS